MGALNKTVFSGITYGVMGMGTEGGATPYRITVAAKGGWGGSPIAQSGFTVGAMQFDFGQRGRDIDSKTGKSYSDSFVDAVNDWARQSNNPLLSFQVSADLNTKGSTIKWLSDTDRATISAFGDTAAGKGWINNHLEKGLISEYEAKITPVLNDAAFNEWAEGDILVATAVLTKAANQSPNRGFSALVSLTKTAHADGYTLDDFLADTKQVEASNSNYHFTKAAEIAKDYVLLRESPEFGPIIESAEQQIADPGFTPASIGSDGDLWFMRKINSDSKFRTDLKAALTQLEDTDGHVSVSTVDKSQIVLVPEDNYVEIMAPKGKQSVIIKDNEAFFYAGGDAEGRRNALHSMENAAQSNGSGAISDPPVSLPSGHWEDTAQHDALGNVIASDGRVWVPDPPATANQTVGSTSPATTAQTPSAASSSTTPAAPNRDFTYHKEDGKFTGAVTHNFAAKADSADGSIKKGDIVTQVFESDGQLSYFSVSHTERGVTTVAERMPSAVEGETVTTYSQWIGNTLTLQGQWDSVGNLVGDRYTVDGLTYARSIGADGQTQWLDPNGLNASERIQQNYDQEAQRLFNVHPGTDKSEAVSFRTLSAEELRALETGLAQASTAGPGTNYADAGSHTGNAVVTDGGSDADQPLNVVDIPVPDLVSHFIGAQNPGTYGSGQLAGFDVLPFNENSSFLVDADGKIIAEINRLPNGYYQLRDLGGNAVYISANDGSVLTQDKYEQAQTEAQDAAQAAQAGQAASAIGLMNSIIGLQHWSELSELGQVAALASIYNTVDKMAGNALPGELTGVVSALGLLNALDQGNVGGSLYSGLSLVEHMTSTAGVANSGWVSLNMPGGANFMPGLGLVLALDSGDPVSILAAAANFIPGYGQIISVVITILGSLFADDDIPMKEGQAQAHWDEAGNILVSTTQDVEGGGASATGWMKSIVDGLQERLAGMTDEAGNPLYGLVPQRLPSLGYQYDPDGFNYAGAQGHLYLKWIDDNGQEQTRYYDGAGNRSDATGDTLAGDFMKHAAQAIVPAWEAQTILAHWQETQASEGLGAANEEARAAAGSGLPQEAADHLSQTLSALTFDVPASTVNATPSSGSASTQSHLIDIDGDGYLEQTQWVQANQALLAIDLDGSGGITAGELLNLNAGSTARNSLGWLDANGDHRLDARDPAFAALRVWLDANGDGQSQGSELQRLGAAAITAIDFSSNPPSLIKADGSRTALTQQQLSGDVLGVAYAATAGGLLESKERGETVLHAINTRAFDGDAAHTQGGDEDSDGMAAGQSALIDPHDARLSTTTARTLANRNNTLGFVPAGAGTAMQAQREATAAMVRSADSSLFGISNGATPLVALALGAGAIQWPSLALADATPSAPIDGNAASAPAQAGIALNVQHPLASGDTPPTPAGSAPAGPADPTRIDLSALLLGRVIADVHPQTSAGVALAGDGDASNEAVAQAEHAQAAIDSIADFASPAGTAASGLSATLTGNGANGVNGAGEMLLAYPEVRGELIAGTEDIGLRFAAEALLANDSTLNVASYLDRPMLSISAVGNPVHGQVALRTNAQGGAEVVFIPEANYYGPASFSYTVTDQYGLSTQASATLQVASVNDAPDTQDETASGDEDNTLMFHAADLLANDSDVDSARDGDVLRITRVGLAQHGMVFLDANGTIRFVPDANYNGPAQFSYWVGDRSEAGMAAGEGLESAATMRLTVLPVNDLPVVIGESLGSDEDVVLNINPALLLANDTDVDMATNGQVLSISAVSGAQHGTVALLADGTIRFTPEQDYFGAASFVYTVDDGNGGRVDATAVVNLAPVNDVPVVNDELLMGKRDATYTLSQAALLANDTDLETPHGLSIVAVQGMTHGNAVLNADGSVTFTPESGYAGRGRFEYVVQDADGGQAVAATEIDFSRINVNPVAVDDSFIGFEDTAFIIQRSQLLVNDSDPDASGLSTLTVDAVRNASHGTVSLQADGSVRFNPDANFYGTASFQYRSNDGEGGQTWATAYLAVQSVNDAPVIEDIWYGDPVYDYYVWTFVPGHFGPPVTVSSGDGDRTYTPYNPSVWQLAPVGSAAGAQFHAQFAGQTQAPPAGDESLGNRAGGLMTASGTPASYSFYQSGEIRPTGFSHVDATYENRTNLGEGDFRIDIVPMDDLFRQHGQVKAYDPDGDSAALVLSVASGPQHGHLWADAYTPANTPSGVLHTQADMSLVSQAGAWQYYSHFGDPYSGGDPFTVRVTDGAGASTDAMLTAAHAGSSAGGGGGGCCPVVIDLAGDGIELIRPEDSNMFADVNDDGWRERMGWAAASDGVLAFDVDNDGRIAHADEVSFVGYKEGARTDLEGLAAFDSDGDAKLTANDAQWARFGVLQDANANGRQDAGELRSLDELGISSISLLREGTPHMNNGNAVFGTSEVQWADGRTTRAGDVMFAGENVALPDEVVAVMPRPVALIDDTADLALAGQARVNQMANVFNQFVNTASMDTPPLGHVSLGSEPLALAELSIILIEQQHFSMLPGAATPVQGGAA